MILTTASSARSTPRCRRAGGARDRRPADRGGVGTHESALPTPERVDLGGRCVLPAFTDSHVHFPTWALARRTYTWRGPIRSARRSPSSARTTSPAGTWIRGTGWRDAAWPEAADAEALDDGDRRAPAALWSKDYHSLWLNSAALARAAGDLGGTGRVVERDAAGGPRASCGRSRPGASATASSWWPRTMGRRRPRRHPLAHSRGVAAVHDKDGWLGAASIFGRIHERRGPDATRLAVAARRPRSASSPTSRCASRIGDDFLRLGYLKAFMDGTLGLADASMLDGSGSRITSREELEDVVRRATRAGWPVPSTRSATGPTAMLSTPSRRRRTTGSRRAAPPDRARPVPRPRGHPTVRGAGHHLFDPVLACTVGP